MRCARVSIELETAGTTCERKSVQRSSLIGRI